MMARLNKTVLIMTTENPNTGPKSTTTGVRTNTTNNPTTNKLIINKLG